MIEGIILGAVLGLLAGAILEWAINGRPVERKLAKALSQRGALAYSTAEGWTPLGEAVVRLERENAELAKNLAAARAAT